MGYCQLQACPAALQHNVLAADLDQPEAIAVPALFAGDLRSLAIRPSVDQSDALLWTDNGAGQFQSQLRHGYRRGLVLEFLWLSFRGDSLATISGDARKGFRRAGNVAAALVKGSFSIHSATWSQE